MIYIVSHHLINVFVQYLFLDVRDWNGIEFQRNEPLPLSVRLIP